MITAIKNCFSSENVNMGRQSELDMAKGFAIVFMIWTHVFEELSPNTEGVLVTLVKNIFGGPFAAPVFMVCLGIGLSYSRNGTPKDLLHRGINLLLIGFLLNAVRYVLPDLIKYALTNDNAYLYDTFLFFSVDILQFAGLAFVFFAMVKELKINCIILLFIGITASLLAQTLRGVSLGNYIADQFAGYIWGTETATYFPFLNWIIFPISGFIFAAIMKHCKDKKGFYLRITPLCAGVMVVYLILTIGYDFMFLSDGSYFFLGLVDALFFVVLVVMVFGLCYGILQLFPNSSFRPLMRWSKNTNNIFCIHWSLIGWLSVVQVAFSITNALPFWQVTLIAIALLLLSDWLSVLYINKIKPLLRRKEHGGRKI